MILIVNKDIVIFNASTMMMMRTAVQWIQTHSKLSTCGLGVLGTLVFPLYFNEKRVLGSLNL